MIFDLPAHTFHPAASQLKDSDENPLFSFIIITYDRPKFLKPAIQSLLYQTYNNIEIVIVDHNAKESNKSIIEDFLKNNDKISIVRFSENYGIYKVVPYCWNSGLQYSSGRFVSVLNDDDMVSANYVEKMVKLFVENPKCITAAPQPYSINEKGEINEDRILPNNRKRYISGLELAKVIINGDPEKLFCAPGGVMCFRKKNLLTSGGFDLMSDLTQIFKHSVLGVTGFDPDAKLFWRHHSDQYNKKLVGEGEVFYKNSVQSISDSGLVEFWEKHFSKGEAKELKKYLLDLLDDQCIDIFKSHLRNGSLIKSRMVFTNIRNENPGLLRKRALKFVKLIPLIPVGLLRQLLRPLITKIKKK